MSEQFEWQVGMKVRAVDARGFISNVIHDVASLPYRDQCSHEIVMELREKSSSGVIKVPPGRVIPPGHDKPVGVKCSIAACPICGLRSVVPAGQTRAYCTCHRPFVIAAGAMSGTSKDEIRH